MEQLLFVRLLQILNFRLDFIVIILLLFIKCICHIDIMANMCQCRYCRDMIRQLVIFLMHRKLLFSALRQLQLFGQCLKFCFYFFQIQPLVRHILKFHTFLYPLFFVVRFRNALHLSLAIWYIRYPGTNKDSVTQNLVFRKDFPLPLSSPL